jgi:starch phosphorylase
MGRSMQNALLNMDLEPNYRKALEELGFKLEDLYECEKDAALGNGGLGRLAACFLDSMATLDLPAWGYGIRYNYGIFKQIIRDGAQVEVPDYWLTFGNPWEIERQDVVVPVRFYGTTRVEKDEAGNDRTVWSGGETVVAVAYDNPIPGFDTWNTINLRLWKALPAREFDFASFNSGDYLRAVESRQRAENISSVLYPADNTYQGKELRLKQQYFFVAATLHDIVRRFKRVPNWKWSMFPDHNAVQLNDTHPTIAIPELMRILVDLEGVPWDEAWAITHKTFGYTNHTILPEVRTESRGRRGGLGEGEDGWMGCARVSFLTAAASRPRLRASLSVPPLLNHPAPLPRRPSRSGAST